MQLGPGSFCFREIKVRTYEKYGAKGFMSSMEIPFLIGLKNTRVDSVFLIWPDNTYQQLPADAAHQTVTYKKGLAQI